MSLAFKASQTFRPGLLTCYRFLPAATPSFSTWQVYHEKEKFVNNISLKGEKAIYLRECPKESVIFFFPTQYSIMKTNL
jgi:hypothetical protein